MGSVKALFPVGADLILSCKNNVSFKTEFQKEYVLYCIVNADTTYQMAYISRSYQVEDYNGLENKTDTALTGAAIKLKGNGNAVYYFSEAVTERNDSSRYNTSQKYYSLNNYKPMGGDRTETEAVLSNGRIFTFSTVAPSGSLVNFKTSSTYYDPTNKNDSGSGWLKFIWALLSSKENATNYYAPKLEIVYYLADSP